jgi:soluble lytic murein transglycosylase-like protein
VRAVRITFVAILLATAADVSRVGAEMFKLTEADGTTHFTNAPTDPRYRRMGFTSGTAAGWLRLPAAAQGDGGPYVTEIAEAAQRYGVPVKLVSAVIRAESGFNPRAVSRKGAQGLMQLMPTTASILGVRNSFDPRENIDGGVRHLRGLIERFPQSLPLAIAAYNAGETAVNSWLTKTPADDMDVFVESIPYAETKLYVKTVTRNRHEYRRIYE